MIPIGLNPSVIGVSSAWWRDAARDAEAAGFSGVWAWDHFLSRGQRTDSVLECWTTLTAAAAVTSRITIGSFVTNVMNRHPALLAHMVATLADQCGSRVEVGIGVGGFAAEMSALGMDFPTPAVRAAMLEEAVAALRLLWTGGPANFDGQYIQLRDAYAQPAPKRQPRIIISGEKPDAARLAARVGDGWTTNAADYERLLPIHLDELGRVGRSRADVGHIVGVSLHRHLAFAEQPLIADMATYAGEWHDRGADELIVVSAGPAEVTALLEAAARAGLGGHSPQLG